jgi:hypothetical protein
MKEVNGSVISPVPGHFKGGVTITVKRMRCGHSESKSSSGANGHLAGEKINLRNSRFG